MLILAIDTTGFSASFALVKDGKEVLFNKIDQFGFTIGKQWKDVPYFLPPCHQKSLMKFLKDAKWNNIDAIAVSAYSGIYNCILVGLSVAKTLSCCYKKPMIRVDHTLAHVYSTWLEKRPENFQFPILVFSASGSHSSFSLLKTVCDCKIIYDAVPQQNWKGVRTFIGIGKVFDLVGRRLELIRPIDSKIGKLMKAMALGDPQRFDFNGYYRGDLLDLDFSGFMKSIDNFLKKEEKKAKLSNKLINDVAASFQESITKILIDKIIRLAEMKKAKEIHVVGGISENKYLEKRLKQRIKKEKLPFILRYPVKKQYRLDNAAMIGCLAYYQQKYKIKFKNFKPNITK